MIVCSNTKKPCTNDNCYHECGIETERKETVITIIPKPIVDDKVSDDVVKRNGEESRKRIQAAKKRQHKSKKELRAVAWDEEVNGVIVMPPSTFEQNAKKVIEIINSDKSDMDKARELIFMQYASFNRGIYASNKLTHYPVLLSRNGKKHKFPLLKEIEAYINLLGLKP